MAASWAGVSVGASTRFGGARAWGRLWLGCALAGGLGTVSAAEWASSKNRFNLNTHITAGNGSYLRRWVQSRGRHRERRRGDAVLGLRPGQPGNGDSLVMSSYSATGQGRDPGGDGRAALGRGIEMYARELGWNGIQVRGGDWFELDGFEHQGAINDAG